jgi:hypothetical protein
MASGRNGAQKERGFLSWRERRCPAVSTQRENARWRKQTEKRHRFPGARYPCMDGGLLFVVADRIVATGNQQHFAKEAGAFANALFDGGGSFRMILEELAGVFTALPQALAVP